MYVSKDLRQGDEITKRASSCYAVIIFIYLYILLSTTYLVSAELVVSVNHDVLGGNVPTY